MAKFDDITRTLRDLAQRLALEGRRTAAITRLRMELAGLDRRRKELFARLGERINDLRLNGQIVDVGLLALLQTELDDIDRVSREIQETMVSIQEINLDGMHVDSEKPAQPAEPKEPSGGLLNSFEVM